VGETASSSGAELAANELAPEPTMTPKASIDIVASAAARGEIAASTRPAPGHGSRNADAARNGAAPLAPALEAREPAAMPLIVCGTGPRRAPHCTQ
jgi:hypothetical protein